MRLSGYSTVTGSRSLPAISCLYNVVKSLTFTMITDKRPGGSSKTGSGAEAEDTQDLAGPVKAIPPSGLSGSH